MPGFVPRFRILAIARLLVWVAFLLSLFSTMSKTKVVSKTSFASLPDSEDRLHDYLKTEGWSDVSVVRAENTVRIEAQSTLFRVPRLLPPWAKLGYQPVGAYEISHGPADHMIRNSLFCAVISTCFLYCLSLVERSGKPRPTSTSRAQTEYREVST